MCFLFLSACAVVNKQGGINASNSKLPALSGQLELSNFTKSDFIIDKAEVTVLKGGEKDKFLLTIRYSKSGIWLISLRNLTGIEGARLYISADTVLINDRLNKVLYMGKPALLLKKYGGIAFNYLPILIGDYIVREADIIKEGNCLKGVREYKIDFIDRNIKYKINCDKAIVNEAIVSSRSDDELLLMKRTDNNTGKTNFFQRKINIKIPGENLNISLSVKKVRFENLDSIAFIPGKNYKKEVIK